MVAKNMQTSRSFTTLSTIFCIATGLAMALACSQAPRSETQARRPNVVFVLTDDQRWDALGSEESPLLGISTPNIDRLAAEGARFENSFVTTSLCSPSRASFLSGLYAHGE